MTDPFDQKPAHEEPTGVAAGLRARRRLLKGAAVGLPAIMTLRSGAVLAAQSLTCLAKRTGSTEQGTTSAEPASASPLTTSSSGADGSGINWARGQVSSVYTVQRILNGQPQPAFNVYFDGLASRWRKAVDGLVVPGAGTTIDESSLTQVYPPSTVNPNDYYTLTPLGNGYYAIGWIDNNGAVQALGPNNVDLPAGASCMTSILNKSKP
ncbi:hypothetical protein EV699_105206 [Plasticicumulans lactativorans]|uniref:Uncharacterized protein n=1 Tax=Plasticicumulans lactativorans TaxID=1133106 RepID=A0A4R2LRX3_9GAMM|nr:hypothetical protein [Plasticicumulans lactativorans]TCO82415.1 hypothetical protein EV699_105206 [Plasticicumulans lactativorans]